MVYGGRDVWRAIGPDPSRQTVGSYSKGAEDVDSMVIACTIYLLPMSAGSTMGQCDEMLPFGCI